MLNRLPSNEKAGATRSPPSHATNKSSGGLLPVVSITPPTGTRAQAHGNAGSGLITLKQFRQDFDRPGQSGGARSLHWASAAPRHSRSVVHIEQGSKSPTSLRQLSSAECVESGTLTPVKHNSIAVAGRPGQTPTHTPVPLPDPFAPNNIPAILSALSSTRRLIQQHQHIASASRIPPRPPPVPVNNLSIHVGPENALFIVPEPLLLSTNSHMLQHWLTSASAYRFAESANSWRLPTIDPHVFATIVDWLAKGSHNWHLPDPEHVLELLAAVHYLDLHKLVDKCLDLVVGHHWIYLVASFGGLAPCLIRAIMRRLDPLGLLHAEMVVAQDLKKAAQQDGCERAGGETKQLWVQHLAQLVGSDGPDIVHWPMESHHISTGSIRRMVLRLLPADRKAAPFVGRERHMEAVELTMSVGDEESRWIARLAKRVARPVHLVLVNGCWPPWTEHVGLLQQRPASPSPSAHSGVRLTPVGCSGAGSLNVNLLSVGADDASTPNPILVYGYGTTWTIPPTSSAIPTSLWPLTHLTLDSCTSLATTCSVVETLCAWIKSSSTCSLTHLIISNSLTLDGMSRILAAGSSRLRSISLDRNPLPASSCTPKSMHAFLKSLRSSTFPHLRLSNAHFAPATLASILDAWPASSQVSVVDMPGLGLGPLLVPHALLHSKPHLTHINVANNRLVARTLMDLIHAASICNRELSVLQVGWNQVTSAVVDALADALGKWPHMRRIGMQVSGDKEHAGWAGGGIVDSSAWKRLFDNVPAGPVAMTLAVAGHLGLVAPATTADELCMAIEASMTRRPMCIVLGDIGGNDNGGGLRWWRKTVDKAHTHPVTVWSTAGIVSNALGGMWDARKRGNETV